MKGDPDAERAWRDRENVHDGSGGAPETGGVAPGVATKFERRTAVAWTGALMVIEPKGTALSSQHG